MAEFAVHICHFATPPAETECLEACASMGRACRKCDVKCYRQGWDVANVTADNARRVREKAGGGQKG